MRGTKTISTLALCLIITLFFSQGQVSAQIYGLPRTGQFASYHYSGINDLGDDGWLRIGYPSGSTRFIDNENGTISDLGTGLLWQKSDSGYQASNGLSGLLSWNESFSYVEGLNKAELGGRSDWRVPNFKELISIANMGTWLPAGYSIFERVHEAPYWSSTHHPFTSANNAPYYIHLSEGRVNFSSTEPAYVKAVASLSYQQQYLGFPKTGQTESLHEGDDGDLQIGYPLSGDPYNDTGETVQQVATGLIWQKTDSNSQEIGDLKGSLTWEEAFEYIQSMNEKKFGGYRDWRMPNYFELLSLIDIGWRYPEAMIDPLFEDTLTDFYWSSTTRFGNSGEAVCVRFLDGVSAQYDKTNTYYLRAVRGGPFLSPSPTHPYPTPTPDPASLTGLPKTGQTAVYHFSSPDDLGDDGALQIGYPLSGNRFASNDDTVMDRATGLIWQRLDSSNQVAGAYSNTMLWEEAFSYVASLNANKWGGYNDWRLPNIKELYSIINSGAFKPASYSVFNSIAKDEIIWSSTTYAELFGGLIAYGLNFNEGLIWLKHLEETEVPVGYVKAVRTIPGAENQLGFPISGQTNIIHYPNGWDYGDDGACQAGFPRSGQRFAINSNGTITDRATTLIWTEMDSSKLEVGGLKDSMEWEDAFNYVSQLNRNHYGGYDTWRLPNIQELFSLIDFGQFAPVINPLISNNVTIGPHWSSTSRFLTPQFRWYVSFTQGGIGFLDTKESPPQKAYVIAVTGGPGHEPGPPQATPSPTPWGYKSPVVITPTPQPPPATPIIIYHPYYGIPKTGQTITYQTGDDGDLKIGYPYSITRWEDLSTGVVVDWATGLMWQQAESNTQSAGGLNGILDWEEAFAYVASLNRDHFGGFSDWRLPNILELLSTRDLGHNSSQNANSFLFTGTTHDPYWSSTCAATFSAGTAVYQMSYGWGQALSWLLEEGRDGAVRACRSFYTGQIESGFPSTGQNIVLHPASGFDLGDDGATQSGYPKLGERFVLEGEYTIRDNATGLTWFSLNSDKSYSWSDAFRVIDYLNNQSIGGYNDWRMPNHDELVSIINYGAFYPVAYPLFADSTSNAWYWSATSHAIVTNNAWAVNFGGGGADTKPKDTLNFVRACRGYPQPGYQPTPIYIPPVRGDYNGDGTTDIAIFRPQDGLWNIRNISRIYFGTSQDIPSPQDYDGNGTWDIAFFRPNNGLWKIRNGTRVYFGTSNDLILPANYDEEPGAEIAFYRPSTGLWKVLSLTRFFFGNSEDIPLPADYDGDKIVDYAYFRPQTGLWKVRDKTRIYFGNSGDTLVPADYTGDGTTEFAYYRPKLGLWKILGVSRIYFGTSGDIPIPGDYDGDGSFEPAYFRPLTTLWKARSATRAYFGLSSDTQISSPYLY